jgi:two-component system invasion response regulator UvrY
MNSVKLSPRQTAIIQLLVDGLTVKEIAILMELSSVTVRKHINKVKKKLGAKTHDHAIALVVARGDVEVIMNIEITPQKIVI